MSKWIKKDDKVIVIAGNSKGATGKVVARLEDRVIVQGVNLCKKHVKKKAAGAPQGIVEMERPIHISNVQLCSDKGDPIKPKVRISANGAKELFYLDGGKEVILRQIKKGS